MLRPPSTFDSGLARRLAAMAGTLILTSPAVATAGGPHPLLADREINAVYQRHCAICHGRTLDGGLGSSLRTTDWEFVTTRDDMLRVLRQGIEDAGMPGWQAIIPEPQLERLADLLLGPASQAADQ
jgi:mono/diheme cytochrome c family protein